MKRNLTVILLLVLAFPVLSFAGGKEPSVRVSAASLAGGEGGQSGLFLTEEPSARVSALGGAAILADDDPGAMYLNPAMLGAMKSKVRLGVSAWKDVAAVGTYSFGYAALKLGKLGAVGLGYLGYASGNEEIYDINGTRMGSVELESDRAISAALGLRLGGGLFAGGQVKSVSSTLAEDYTADTMTFDAGVMFKGEKLTLGAAMQNMTGELKYRNTGDPLLRVMRAGAAYKLGRAVIGVEAQKPADSGLNFGAGLEYRLAGLALRGGFKQAGGDEKETSITAGAGFKFGGVGLDYAFQPAGNLGETLHKLTLNIGFGIIE